jgi:hypothetical protein
LLGDSSVRAAASERAYALARDEFSWLPILDRLEGIYSDAISRRSVNK